MFYRNQEEEFRPIETGPKEIDPDEEPEELPGDRKEEDSDEEI